MAHLHHVTEAAEWPDGAVGGGGKQEDRGKEDEEEGVKVCRKT